MIKKEFFKKIGLTEEQTISVMECLEKESRLRRLFHAEHIEPIEPIVRTIDVNSINFSNEELLREKIRTEYADMIPKKK